MTFKELAAEIANMTAEDQDQTLRMYDTEICEVVAVRMIVNHASEQMHECDLVDEPYLDFID